MAIVKIVKENGDGTFSGHLEQDGEKILNSDREAKSKIGIGSLLGTLMKNLPDPIEFEGAVKNTVTESTPPVESPSKPVMNKVSGVEPSIGIDVAEGNDFTAIATIEKGEITAVEVTENTTATTEKTEEKSVDPSPSEAKEKKMVSAPATGVKPQTEQRENYLKRLDSMVTETTQIDGVQVHIIDSLWASSLKFDHKEVGYSLDIVSPTEIYVSRTTDVSLGVCYFDQHIPKLINWMQNGMSLEDTGNTIHEKDKLFKSHMIIWNFSNYKILASKKV